MQGPRSRSNTRPGAKRKRAEKTGKPAEKEPETEKPRGKDGPARKKGKPAEKAVKQKKSGGKPPLKKIKTSR